MPGLHVVPADLDDPRVIALLEHHVATAQAETARGSAHALDLPALKAPGISAWAIWQGDDLMGLGALKWLSPDHGEVKSMHTAATARRRGVAAAMLTHLIATARAERFSRLSLETGSWAYFDGARALYARHGFVECAPFAGYVPDPHSVFMTLDLTAAG